MHVLYAGLCGQLAQLNKFHQFALLLHLLLYGGDGWSQSLVLFVFFELALEIDQTLVNEEYWLAS